VKKKKRVKLYNDDCLKVLKRMKDNSVHSLVTDPPAGINFMNKKFDSDRGGRDHWIEWMTEIMIEVKRVLKPGAHGFVWSIPRTSHWTATALENSGLEIRDIVVHLFGSGFPKSHNCLKRIAKDLGCKLEKKNVNNVLQDFYQLKDQKEMGGQDIVQGNVLVKVNKKGKLKYVKSVKKNSIINFQNLKEKIGIIKEPIALINVKLNGKKKTLILKIIPIGRVENLSEKMDMLELVLEKENIDSNMILSWKNILKGNLKKVKTFTIETAINKIIDLKICSY